MLFRQVIEDRTNNKRDELIYYLGTRDHAGRGSV